MLVGSSPGQKIKRLSLAPIYKTMQIFKAPNSHIPVFSFYKSIIGGLGARDISNLNAVFANL